MPDKILTHEDIQKAPLRDFIVQHFSLRQHRKPPPFSAARGKVDAYINDGRWVADCPNKCGCALIVSKAEPFFICVNCQNVVRNVKFPDDVEMGHIEYYLLKRRRKEDRHWTAGVPVSRIIEENTNRIFEVDPRA